MSMIALLFSDGWVTGQPLIIVCLSRFLFLKCLPESDVGLCRSFVFLAPRAISFSCQFHNFVLRAVFQLSEQRAVPKTILWEDDFRLVRTTHALMWCRFLPSRNSVRCRNLFSWLTLWHKHLLCMIFGDVGKDKGEFISFPDLEKLTLH